MWSTIRLGLALVCCVAAQPSWPSANDELEELMFQTSGYRARQFAAPVTPCSSGNGGGRVTAAEWVRTAFHDMSTANTYQGTGGLDASIVYELGNGDNAGSAFNTTLLTLEPFYGPRTSMADLLALGTYAAIRSCGGPILSVKTGRVDASRSGGTGVPQPQNAIGIFRNQFLRMGFNDSQMITLVACGHSLGSVHAANNPLIVAPGSAPPDDVVSMDSTPSTFDNKIATEYILGNTTDPLVRGLSEQYRRNSDKVVFSADGNATITTLTDSTVFQSQCQIMLTNMINVVPGTVSLSTDPIVPYEVRPYGLQLYLLDEDQLRFAGDIRVLTTSRSVSSVQLIYQDRTGEDSCATCTISARFAGTGNGLDDAFSFYSFSTNISSSTSISSFVVQITYSDGTNAIFDNNGSNFLVQDILLYQAPQSCATTSSSVTITAAIRSDSSESPNLNTITKAYSGNIIRPVLNTTTTPLTLISSSENSTIGPYTLYTTTVSLNAAQITPGTLFNLTTTDTAISISYQSLPSLQQTCSPIPSNTSPPSPPASATPLGCYTDSSSSRTLSSPSGFSAYHTSDTQMTPSYCATLCHTYEYYGTEYSRECFCSNTLSASATNSTPADLNCNMPCTGDSTLTCGGSGYITVYRNPLSNLPASPPTVTAGSSSTAIYSYVGCLTDSPSERVLATARHDDSSMTLDLCARFCATSYNSTFFGTEYGAECYCGDGIGERAELVSVWDCAMGCAGDPELACGNANRLTVYQRGDGSEGNVGRVRRRNGHSHGHKHVY